MQLSKYFSMMSKMKIFFANLRLEPNLPVYDVKSSETNRYNKSDRSETIRIFKVIKIKTKTPTQWLIPPT